MNYSAARSNPCALAEPASMKPLLSIEAMNYTCSTAPFLNTLVLIALTITQIENVGYCYTVDNLTKSSVPSLGKGLPSSLLRSILINVAGLNALLVSVRARTRKTNAPLSKNATGSGRSPAFSKAIRLPALENLFTPASSRQVQERRIAHANHHPQQIRSQNIGKEQRIPTHGLLGQHMPRQY